MKRQSALIAMDRESTNTIRPADKRAATRWSVKLRCSFLSAGESYDAIITDISAGGAFIEAGYCPQPDTTATLQIRLGGAELSIRGIVRHSGWFLMGFRNGNGFGFEFENLSGNAQVFVRKVLAQLTQPAEPKTCLEL